MTDPIVPANEPPLRRRFAGGRTSVAPALSVVGLLVAGLLTAQVYMHWTPTLSTAATPSPTTTPVPLVSGETPTPAPTATAVTNLQISVPGTLVYSKGGNLWVQSGTTARQITQSVNGSLQTQPAFSPDGQWIYYIDTRTRLGWEYDWTYHNEIAHYTLNYPVLCRIHPDGTGQKDVLSSLVKVSVPKAYSPGLSFYWILEPSISPNGATAAVMSNGPSRPQGQDVVIHYVNLTTGKLGPALPLNYTPFLGLSDPAFSPDGSILAYTMEGRTGSYVPTPSLWTYTGGVAHELAAGYRAASWSPDGKYMAATRVAGNTLNIAVLDARTGKLVDQVTTDGASWAPVWSPDGDKLVYMHLSGPNVELNMVYISGTGPNFTFKIEPNLTDYSGLDGQSTAAWYVPGFGPTPAPSPTDTAGASGSAAAASPSPTVTAPVISPSPS